MSLDDRLEKIFEKRKGSILIVDNLNHVEQNEEIKSNLDELKEFASSNNTELDIQLISHKQVDDVVNREYDLMLVNTNNSFDGNGISNTSKDIMRGMTSVTKLTSPNLKPELYINLMKDPNSRAINDSINKLTGILINPQIYNSKEFINPSNYPSLVHLLAERMTGKFNNNGISASQHDYSANLWKKFIPFIDKSLNAGNNQTNLNYNFLILSDLEKFRNGNYNRRNRNNIKLDVQAADYKLTDHNIENVAAIFVDNEWNKLTDNGALGKGIQTLKRVKQEMDNLGLDTTIIYQSGHSRNLFTESEIEEIENNGGILATKDFFPKIYKDQVQADKEVEALKVLGSVDNLSNYIPNFCQQVNKKDISIICTQIINGTTTYDNNKTEIFNNLNIDDNGLNHKAYVLSLLHGTTKSEIANEKFQPTSKDFFSFEEISEKGGFHYRKKIDDTFEEVVVKTIYEKIVEKHRQFETRVLTHNDAKWDNWFDGKILGDFGSLQAGTEYKDLAKALMDPTDNFDTLKDERKVDDFIENYLSFRKNIDPSTTFDKEEFKTNVYDMILTESLRTIAYKSSDKYISNGLIDVVKQYSQKLNTTYLMEKEYV